MGKKGFAKKPYSPPLAPYQIHYPSKTPRNQRVWNDTYLQLASFDPAEVNLAVRIERRFVYTADGQYWKTWTSCPELPDTSHGYQLRPQVNTATSLSTTGILQGGQGSGIALIHPNQPAYGPSLTQFDGPLPYRISIQTLYHERLNLRGDNIAATLMNVFSLLKDLLPLLIGCHVIVIERQLWAKNPDASRIFQHILSCLICHLENSPLCPDIMEVDAKWVKEVMGLQLGKGKGNKTIMPYRIRALFYFYGENVGRQILSRTGKLDDLSDVEAQIETICRKTIGFPALLDPGSFVSWANLDVIKASYTQLGVGTAR